MSDLATCHSCDLPVPADSRIFDTHDECLNECLCYVCREVRAEMAEDHMADLAGMAWRESL